MLGSNGEREVPYSLGVNAVDGYLENVVLTLVLWSSVCVMLVSNGVSCAVDLDGLNVGGVTERLDTRDILDGELAVNDILLENNLLCL